MMQGITVGEFLLPKEEKCFVVYVRGRGMVSIGAYRDFPTIERAKTMLQDHLACHNQMGLRGACEYLEKALASGEIQIREAIQITSYKLEG